LFFVVIPKRILRVIPKFCSLAVPNRLRQMCVPFSGRCECAFHRPLGVTCYAIGFGLNYKTMDLARQSALDACHNSTGGAAKERCEVVATFHNQCVASAIDPKAGTPGAGWAIGDTQKAADDEALSRCRNTAGADRIAFCKIEDQLCDGDAK